MTLNLPPTLHVLNHHRQPPSPPVSFPVPGFPFEVSSTSISRFSRNVPHLPWHSTPSHCRSGGYTFARLLPSLRPRSTFPTLFSRTVRRSSRDLLPTILAPVSRSPPAYRDDVLFLLPSSRPISVGLSLPRSAAAIPNLPILIYIRAIAYRLRPIRRR